MTDSSGAHVCASSKYGLFKQFVRFGVVGVIGFVVNAVTVESLALVIGPIWAQVLAFPIAVSVTWLLNRHYTFGISRHPWRKELLRYVAVNMLGWMANSSVYFFLILKYELLYQNPSIAVAAGSLVGMVFNFSSSKWFAFR